MTCFTVLVSEIFVNNGKLLVGVSVWFSHKEDGIVFSFDIGNECFPSILCFLQIDLIRDRELDLRLWVG